MQLLGSHCDECDEHLEEAIARQHTLIIKLEDELEGVQEQLSAGSITRSLVETVLGCAPPLIEERNNAECGSPIDRGDGQ